MALWADTFSRSGHQQMELSDIDMRDLAKVLVEAESDDSAKPALRQPGPAVPAAERELRTSRLECALKWVFFLRASREGTIIKSSFSLGSATGRLPLPWKTIVSCRGCRPLIIEVVQSSTVQLGAEDDLDAAHQGLVFASYEGEGIACLLGPAGAADPVGVGIRCVRHVIIDHVGNP
jgi:hypothetical protein